MRFSAVPSWGLAVVGDAAGLRMIKAEQLGVGGAKIEICRPSCKTILLPMMLRRNKLECLSVSASVR